MWTPSLLTRPTDESRGRGSTLSPTTGIVGLRVSHCLAGLALSGAIALGISGFAFAQQAAPAASDSQAGSRTLGVSAGSAAPSNTPANTPAPGPSNVGSLGQVPAPASSVSTPARSSPATDDSSRGSNATFAPAFSAAAPPSGTAGPRQPIRANGEAPPRRFATRVSSGSGSLPNDSGQLYREYDISPYTARITTTKRPEQAIIDWILRETGYEAWHGEPLAILSAGPRTLRAYHTAQVQSVVAEIVDRFNSTEAESQAFSLRLITLDGPEWRIRVQRLLTPVPVQSQGVQAWVLEKESAAALLAELRRRRDYREHNSPQLLVQNGQSTVVSATRGRNYVRDIKVRPDVWPGYEPDSGIIDEGFSLEFTPLMSLDGKQVDAAIRCDIDQVERMVPVMLDVATAAAPRQRTKIDIPQTARFRFHERFRWPADQILILGLGMVPLPVPGEAKSLVPGLPLPVSSGPPRADLLLVVENRGRTAAQTPPVNRDASAAANSYPRGR